MYAPNSVLTVLQVESRLIHGTDSPVSGVLTRMVAKPFELVNPSR